MPILLLVIPAVLIVRQPDLGTSVLLIATGIAMLFVVGVRIWMFILGTFVTIGLSFHYGNLFCGIIRRHVYLLL